MFRNITPVIRRIAFTFRGRLVSAFVVPDQSVEFLRAAIGEDFIVRQWRDGTIRIICV